MIRRPGHLFTKREIFSTLWPDTAVTDHALTRVVAQLRRVLGDEARESRYLETVPTRGYRWIRPVTVDSVVPASVPAMVDLTIDSHPWSRRIPAAAVALVAVMLTVPSAWWMQHRLRLSTSIAAAVTKANDNIG